MASTAVFLTPVEEEKADRDCLLTVLVNVSGVPCALAKRHPVCLALKHNGVVHFLAAFIHMTSANIDLPQHIKSGVLVPLEMSSKMMI